jgi:hypothetical protein
MSSQMDDDLIVPQPVDRPNDAPGDWIPAVHEPRTRRHTGVIIGIGNMSGNVAKDVERILVRKFPEVTIAVITSSSSSVAFEWDADE